MTSAAKPAGRAPFARGILALLAPVLLCACGAREERLQGAAMGTTWQVTLVGKTDREKGFTGDEKALADKEKTLEALYTEITAVLEEVNQSMSTYIDSSEVMRFNRVPVGQWFGVSHPLALLVARAKKISEQTGGSFDITLGGAVNLWSFGPNSNPNNDTGAAASIKESRPPPQSKVTAACKEVGWQHLQVRLSPPSLMRGADFQMDLSAIAKGYGVDRVASLLDMEKIENYLVELGGEVRVRGRNARGRPWRLGILDPEKTRKVRRTLDLPEGLSVATSGDYHNYFEWEGKRYSHTLDPRNCLPVEHRLASVTVVADDATTADALATAINVMGAEKGYDFAAERGIAAMLVARDEKGRLRELFTPAFSAGLK